MTEKNSEAPNSNLSRTLTDDQIVTEKKVRAALILERHGDRSGRGCGHRIWRTSDSRRS